MNRAEMKALEVGALVQSTVNYDRGSVLKRTDLGILVRWSTGIREFVLFSEEASLMHPRGVPADMCPVQRGAMLRRQLIVNEDTSTREQERILEDIARLRAQPRPNDLKVGTPSRVSKADKAKHYAKRTAVRS